MIRWLRPHNDQYQTACGQGRVQRLDSDYYALWTFKNGQWVSVKTWTGKLAFRRSLPTAKAAVEQALSRKSKTSTTEFNPVLLNLGEA